MERTIKKILEQAEELAHATIEALDVVEESGEFFPENPDEWHAARDRARDLARLEIKVAEYMAHETSEKSYFDGVRAGWDARMNGEPWPNE